MQCDLFLMITLEYMRYSTGKNVSSRKNRILLFTYRTFSKHGSVVVYPLGIYYNYNCLIKCNAFV